MAPGSPLTDAVRDCAGCSLPYPLKDLFRCSRCTEALYCSSLCQKAHWGIHKPRCCFPILSETWAVTVTCDEDRRGPPFRSTVVGSAHGIHTYGVPSPVSSLVSVPILVYRHIREGSLSMTTRKGLDNQIVTYLMIDPLTGFAPPE
ncbi:hypothetical protein PLICRDRAFT_119711 [Plicaturopsis crispa FD-325 SS-3]|uniref:MYND-type domain-containing protein n=1 Tax=Plicaturopsis crispa FD-325 SS-3 TaxID=944288 RepID=A0A0C9SK68_PLICR|nr:hypothetical protein PLICRDRAFT_119711 [Plicaturopsis crispa FD-325 SS-3]